MKRAACRPIAVAVDAHRGQRRAAGRRRTRGRRSRPPPVAPAPRCRAPAPRSARRARAGRSCRRRRRAARALPAARPSAARPLLQRRRRRHDDHARLGAARARAAGRDEAVAPAQRALVVAGDQRQPAAARAGAGTRPPRARPPRARSRPACRSASASGPRSRRPECRDASRRWRPAAECMMPVSTMPSGRRPMMASSSASSRLPP